VFPDHPILQPVSALKSLLLLYGLLRADNMSEINLNPVVYSKNVVEFVTVANEFCHTVEKVNEIPVKESLQTLQKILPLLYLKATMLPKTEKMLVEELEKYVSEMDYNVWYQRWLQALGEHDNYYEVFDPNIQFGDETVTASISESLMDIYQDMKNFLNAYSLGDEEIMNDALTDCVFHFEDFWGQRLVNLLRAIHMLITSDVDFSEMEDEKDIKPGTGNAKWLDKFWDNSKDED
jgi:hypothetical protein